MFGAEATSRESSGQVGQAIDRRIATASQGERAGVHVALDEECRGLIECHRVVNMLEERLATVLEPVPSSPQSSTNAKESDPFTVLDKVHALQRLTSELDGRLTRLIQRIQL